MKKQSNEIQKLTDYQHHRLRTEMYLGSRSPHSQTIVNWDGDLRLSKADWTYHDFLGKKWQNVNKPERQAYLKNAYRVLLTRARQGMVIFVPPGDPADHTRPPGYYDPVYRYLSNIGMSVL